MRNYNTVESADKSIIDNIKTIAEELEEKKERKNA